MEESIIYVDIDATEGENDGSSWGNAYTDLQSALAAAGASDQIWVAEGTYLPVTGNNAPEGVNDIRRVSFEINNGVKVYGGFAGNETSLEERDRRANQTILSGNIGEDTQADNSYHVVDISGSPASTVIDGFTISGGQADGAGGFRRQDDGGGIFTRSDASAVLRNLVIENNFASANGGGIYLEDENSPTIINVTFRNNSASTSGGAIHAESRNNLNVFSSLFVNNQSQGGGAIQTGGLNPNINLINNTFYNNIGGTSGAVLDGNRNRNSTNIINNIFWDNEVFGNPQVVLGDGSFGGLLDEITNFSNNIIKGSVPEFESGETTSEGNITDDPLFVDPENNDFRLRLDSPGINTGINEVVGSEEDVANNPRIYNETVDVGAYEYGLYLDVDDVRVTEGDEGTTEATFTVSLEDTLGNPPTGEVSVSYATEDDRANAGTDFTSASGTLTFAPEDNEKTVTIDISTDLQQENNETYFVNLSNATGGAVIRDGQGVGIISNDDIVEEGDTVYRFLNPDAGVHFYTASEVERDNVLENLTQYEFEGASYVSAPESNDPASGISPVYRFLNQNTGVHLYTIDENERNFIEDNLDNYSFEGVVYYGYEQQQEGTIPLYRFYNPVTESHFYTPSAGERDNVIENLPNYEVEGTEGGIAFYVQPLDI